MAVVLLTNNSNRGQAIAHLMLRAGIDLRLVVVEDASLGQAPPNLFKVFLRNTFGPPYRWVKSMITMSSTDRNALAYEAECIKQSRNFVSDYITSLNFSGRPEGVEYLETSSLNEAIVVTAVKKAEPDLCVVLGTSIIKPRLISIPKIGLINSHTSVLPEYRGSRSEFWQCYNQDYKNVGLTLHFIDPGVDTGKIIFQKKQDVGENPNPEMLRAVNTVNMLENYIPTIQSVLKGKVQPKEQDQCTTPTYKFRDITLEKRLKLYKRLVSEELNQPF